jgi:hypothetical protein
LDQNTVIFVIVAANNVLQRYQVSSNASATEFWFSPRSPVTQRSMTMLPTASSTSANVSVSSSTVDATTTTTTTTTTTAPSISNDPESETIQIPTSSEIVDPSAESNNHSEVSNVKVETIEELLDLFGESIIPLDINAAVNNTNSVNNNNSNNTSGGKRKFRLPFLSNKSDSKGDSPSNSPSTARNSNAEDRVDDSRESKSVFDFLFKRSPAHQQTVAIVSNTIQQPAIPASPSVSKESADSGIQNALQILQKSDSEHVKHLVQLLQSINPGSVLPTLEESLFLLSLHPQAHHDLLVHGHVLSATLLALKSINLLYPSVLDAQIRNLNGFNPLVQLLSYSTTDAVKDCLNFLAIAFHAPNGKADNVRAFVDSGGMEKLSDCLMRNDVEIQKAACEVLVLVFGFPDAEPLPRSLLIDTTRQTNIGKLLVALIEDLMQPILMHALRALKVLALAGTDMQEMLFNCGVLTKLMEIVRQVSSMAIFETATVAAINTLSAVVNENVPIQNHLLDIGDFQSLWLEMVKTQSQSMLIMACFRLVHHLTVHNADAKLRFLKMNFFDCCLELIQQRPIDVAKFPQLNAALFSMRTMLERSVECLQIALSKRIFEELCSFMWKLRM